MASPFPNDGSFLERFKQQQQNVSSSPVLKSSSNSKGAASGGVAKGPVSNGKLAFSLKQKSKLAVTPVKLGEDEDDEDDADAHRQAKRAKSETGPRSVTPEANDSVPPPPSDGEVKKVADKLALFVAKNGRQFEDITRQKNPGNTPFRGPHSYVSESDMMPLTLHDHVLECALFQQTKPDGRVAILTDDTTLKIKALAESLVVDTAINFCDSLLNPYSDRFVYSGSTPIGRSSIGRQHEKVNDGLSTPGTAISSSKWPTPAVARSLSRQDTPRPSSRANFSTWRKSQPLGLQALL